MEYSYRLREGGIVDGGIMADLLDVKNLSVSVEEKAILDAINLTINKGETHVLMGPNGAGKSTLGNAIMGNPRYTITGGNLFFNGENITAEPVDKRAKRGIFLSFQNPLEVPGVSLGNFIRSAMEERFGKKKKAEILQLLMLKPELAILDETDSGLDVDAVRTVSEGVKAYQKNMDGALLIITHSTRILEALNVDKTHVIINGKMKATGDGSLVNKINDEGFESFLEG